MPRVLRIINRFNLGGPTYNVAYLTKYLQPDFDTLLVGGSIDKTEGSSEYILDNLGIKAKIIPEMCRSINPVRDCKAFLKLRKVIKEFKPDIVHTHAAKSGTLGRLAALSCGVPVIIHTFHGHVFHSYFNSLSTYIFKIIERFLAKKSNAIIAISQRQKEELCNIHKIAESDKFVVIPLGFDLDRFSENMDVKRKNFRNHYNISDEHIAVGIVGRLVPVKNHSLFIKTIKKLTESTKKQVKYFIIGDGESRKDIEKEATDSGLTFSTENDDKFNNNLCFTSWITNVDYVNAGLDIVVLTSFNEGTPVSLIEAQAANRVVVSTDVGGISDVVDDKVTGFLCRNNDLEDFSSKLLLLIEDDELRKSMSEQGRNYVYERYSYKRLVADMHKLYLELLNKSK